MIITGKTVKLLQRLVNGESINVGEFSSEQQKELIAFLVQKQCVSFHRIGKSRGTYYATDKALLQEICGHYDPSLSNLNAAALEATGALNSRSDKVAHFGNSKLNRANRTIKGFTLLADRPIEVRYLGEIFIITPLAGLHVVSYQELSLPQDATVIIVENPECFYDTRWIVNVGLPLSSGPYILFSRFPVCEEGKLWLEAIPNKIMYFGDFDLAGVRIYETEFKRRLGDRISFILPSDLEDRIRKQGNPALYTKQVNEGFANLKSNSGELTNLINLLHHLQSGYEQEGYCCEL